MEGEWAMKNINVPIKSKLYLFIVLISVLLLPIQVWAAQTVHIKLRINGTDIQGESTISSLDRADTIEASSAGFNVFTPTDSTGASTGRRVYRPFTVLKRIDKSTPLLFKALVQNELVDRLEAMYFRPDTSGSGAEEKFMTIVLENGRISSIVQTSEDAIVAGQNAPPVMELVSFNFQSITITYVPNGATHTDNLTSGF
jgi:type VI secretion system secreted protein Hcp